MKKLIGGSILLSAGGASLPDMLWHWKFEEASGDFADATGNGNTGEARDQLTYQQPGVDGFSVQHGGGQVRINSPHDFYDPGNEWTCTAFFKSTGAGPFSGNKQLVAIARTNKNDLSAVRQISNSFELQFYVTHHGEAATTVNTGVDISDSDFMFFAIRRKIDGPDYIYDGWINDTKYAITTRTASASDSNNAEFSVGGNFSGNNNVDFPGFTDQCRVWDVALTDEQIESLVL